MHLVTKLSFDFIPPFLSFIYFVPFLLGDLKKKEGQEKKIVRNNCFFLMFPQGVSPPKSFKILHLPKVC